MKYKKRFESALSSHEPLQALNALIFELAAKGYRKTEIYQFFEAFILDLRQNSGETEAKEELLMEVMDALTGWCHPNAQLRLPIFLDAEVDESVRKYVREKNLEAGTIVNQWVRDNIAALQAYKC